MAHVVIVTAAHAFPFVPVFHVDPRTQFTQPEFAVSVPATKPLPLSQFALVWAAHAFWSLAPDHCTDVHATQPEFAVGVPATKPLPLSQFALVWSAHAFWSLAPDHCTDVHVTQPEFAVVVPATKP